MIDEKKLIEEFREKVKGYDKDCGYWSKRGEHGNELLCAGKCSGIVQAIKIAENQPKVGEWIPCSERFPELHRVDMQSSGEYYMISDSVIITDGESIGLTKYEVDDDDRKGWLECEFEGNEDVVAWMPLPEPYKGE